MRLHLLALLLAAPLAAAVPLNGTSNSSAPLSRCGGSGDAIDCEHNVATVSERWVGWQVPLGDTPARGWPAVIIYHGWNLWNSEYCWYATPQYSFGLYHKAEVVRDLLDSGYAVITPDALSRLGYWETNVNRYAVADLSIWEESEDHRFVEELLRRTDDGEFGSIDMQRLSAIGFSSGAYMTSRMAVNYPHRFRSFAVVGGAYYYCSGSCSETVANDVAPHVWELHGPTLFLANSNDGTGAHRATHAHASESTACCPICWRPTSAWGSSSAPASLPSQPTPLLLMPYVVAVRACSAVGNLGDVLPAAAIERGGHAARAAERRQPRVVASVSRRDPSLARRARLILPPSLRG
jgi:dienelactone hydrolase